jgi:S1-C subfamily serine protease
MRPPASGASPNRSGRECRQRGHVRTNHHVVEFCPGLSIRQPSRPLRPARLVAKDATKVSAPVHQGNSGSPVLDRYGTIAGVVQSKPVAFNVRGHSAERQLRH